ncbi:MAG: hypothetical protein H0W58_07435 [Acidobacteria bacterium]|jgi:hypothetical protein|nr:hypothetical protein [Acidobacteriota bacterium]
MKKNNHYKKEIEFKLGEGYEAEHIEFSKSNEGKEFGLTYTKFSGGEGFTFGGPPNPFEREGKELPTPDSNLPHQDFHFEFDVRFTLNESEDIELLIAQKDMPTPFKFMLKGLSPKQAQMALIDFEQRISNVIKDAIYFHAWACYRKQDENIKNRNESYDKIMKNLVTHFKPLLKWKRDKVIEQREENGIKITTYDPFPKGANPQTKAEIEKEKQEFRKAVFAALNEIGSGKKTQLDVGLIVFEKELDAKEDIDIASRMKHALNKYNLKFKELLEEYKQKKADNSI